MRISDKIEIIMNNVSGSVSRVSGVILSHIIVVVDYEERVPKRTSSGLVASNRA